MHDLVIRNATIVDGTGAPRRSGDVVADAGHIVEVTAAGAGPSSAGRVIDAQGDLLTPGFVDIHTHYDGQVCWDKQVTPSCWHGVTSIVMGNCGVGFAPVRAGTEGELVSLMESVEDIPGTALHEGIPWGWETFAEYLDAIDTPYSVDIGTQVPHVAIRHYVMGERCYDEASPQDMAEMRDITRVALKAGALGFTTSRFYGHIDKAGNLIPGTRASAEEIQTIASAFAGLGRGTMEFVSDSLNDPDELAWIERITRDTGCTITPLAGPGAGPIWSLAEKLSAEGLQLRPQVGARPASILMTLEGTINPMRQFPAYREIHELPVAERRARLRDPVFRQRVLTEEPILPRNADAVRFITDHAHMYVMDAALSYEPGPQDSVAAVARSRGIDPREVMMDTLADDVPLLVLFGSYGGDLEGQRAAIEHPQSVFGLSDGGAHCGVLVDASVPTYMLSYFTRDRTRGPRMDLEFVVHKLTQNSAQVYGLNDRGVIAPGYKADFNLIDYDALHLKAPKMVYDLPAGGKRLVQKAEGYRMTIQSGEVTYEAGEHTGAMPGRLLRGSQRPQLRETTS
ncbi:MAG: amidohydrolase family protein [Gammaproteobacteria bacterium]|nr:amidohydrolase family protein [Gammaproteobacteria bacterium]